MNPVPPPITQDDHGRIEQEEHRENVDDEAPIVDDVEPTEQEKQARPPPHLRFQ